MKKLFLLLLPLYLQAQVTSIRPDCQLPVNIPVGSTVPYNVGPFDNRTAGCVSWTFVYNSYTYSALSILVQTAPNATPGQPGSWSTFTAATGSNPQTDTTKGVAQFGGPTSYFPWVRVQLTSATGAGTISGTLYGYRNPATSADAPVTPVAPGLPFNSVQYNCAGSFCGAGGVLFNGTGVGVAYFIGMGLDDMTSGGSYTDDSLNPLAAFQVVIDTTGTPDTFQWQKNSGGLSASIPITGGPQTLSDGVTVTFAATTGHNVTDQWDFSSQEAVLSRGHNAMGSDSAVNGGSVAGSYASVILDLEEDMTGDFRNGGRGILNYTHYTQTSANLADVGGFEIDSTINQNGFDISRNRAGFLSSQVRGNNNTGELAALTMFTYNLGPTNTVTNEYGLRLYIANQSSGLVGNGYGVYVGSPIGSGPITRNIAYFNGNQCTAGTVTCFGWYGEGGTWHQETGGDTIVGVEVEAAATQTADLFRTLASDGTTVGSGFSNAGYPFTRLNAAPASVDMLASEEMFWFDPTNGASAFNVKAKQADGTVETLSIPMGSVFPTPGTYVTTARNINTTSPITGGGNLSADRTIACATCGVTGSPLSQFAATTSAQFLGVISDETGSGFVVGSNTPTLTTPIFAGTAFAGLGASTNGSNAYCTDCTVTSAIDDTCAASGSGATAQRVNGAWKCNI